MSLFNNIAANINTSTLIGQKQRAYLDALEQRVKNKERDVRFELMNNIDSKIHDNIPSLHMLSLTSYIGEGRKIYSYDDYHNAVSTYMNPLLDNCTPIVSKAVKQLYSSYLINQFTKQTDPTIYFYRKYLVTDQVNIYVFHIVTHSFLLTSPELFPSLHNVYCIVTSQSAINPMVIDFSILSQFYQRQLISCGVKKSALIHLYQELKETYSRLCDANDLFQDRWGR